MRRELGDNRHNLLEIPVHYLLAEAQGLSPCAALGPNTISPPTSPDQKLTEFKVEHFAACLRYLARCSKQQDQKEATDKPEQRSNVASRLLNGKVHFDTDSEMSEVESSDDDRESNDSSPRPGYLSPSLSPLQMVSEWSQWSLGY